jgi:arginine N-succinyltransferase
MTARTDRVRSIAEAKTVPVSEIGTPEGAAGRALVATGKLANFRCCFAQIALQGEGMVVDPAAAEALGVGPGDMVWHVPR